MFPPVGEGRTGDPPALTLEPPVQALSRAFNSSLRACSTGSV